MTQSTITNILPDYIASALNKGEITKRNVTIEYGAHAVQKAIEDGRVYDGSVS